MTLQFWLSILKEIAYFLNENEGVVSAATSVALLYIAAQGLNTWRIQKKQEIIEETLVDINDACSTLVKLRMKITLIGEETNLSYSQIIEKRLRKKKNIFERLEKQKLRLSTNNLKKLSDLIKEIESLKLQIEFAGQILDQNAQHPRQDDTWKNIIEKNKKLLFIHLSTESTNSTDDKIYDIYNEFLHQARKELNYRQWLWNSLKTKYSIVIIILRKFFSK